MHTYPSYVAPSGRAIVEFVKDHPFAVLATSTGGAPVATHRLPTGGRAGGDSGRHAPLGAHGDGECALAAIR